MPNAVDVSSYVSRVSATEVANSSSSSGVILLAGLQATKTSVSDSSSSSQVVLLSLPPISMNQFGGGGSKILYRKRAWRAESAGFVYWNTYDLDDTYPGGGTLTPPQGVVLCRS